MSKSATPSTTFYYTKDIQYLLHEPLLSKFRDQKALAKKISKALGRNEVSDAARLERNLTPRIKLDHIIKERYPTFVDALRDLDDALSMLFLFANLPSTADAPPKLISRCQRLTMEFEHYLIRTNSLRKSFLSIKGIYYQATIQGQDILWLVPYKFVQRAGPDVDFRVMSNFVEFYATLLGFVNFRLYTGVGLVYPPRFDLQREERGAELGAFHLERQTDGEEETPDVEIGVHANEKAQAEADRLLSMPEAEQNIAPELTAREPSDAHGSGTLGQETNSALDTFTSIDPAADSLLQPSLTADKQVTSKLLEPFTFFVSRETPRHPLEFILKAFGCKRVGWDSTLGEGAYCAEDDSRITHQIVDRPDIPLPSPPLTDGEPDEDDEADLAAARKRNERVPGRTYVQPQWVWDSINAGKLQRPDLYAPGATLPPHLSPWVKPKKGEYDPTAPLADQETEAEREVARIQDDAVSDGDDDEAESVLDEGNDDEDLTDVRSDGKTGTKVVQLDNPVRQGEGMDVELAGSSDEDEDGTEDAPKAAGDDFGGFSGEEEEEEGEPVGGQAATARAHQAELEAEALGRQVPSERRDTTSSRLASVKAKKDGAAKVRDEETERRKMMMSRRKRKMYDKMAYSNARKDEEAEKLRGKRRKIEKRVVKGA